MNMQAIDWHSSTNHILLNPRFSMPEKLEILDMLSGGHGLQSHFWIATSGSTSLSPGKIKWTALSKEAIIASALAVNDILSCTSSDKWLNLLPHFHVGGLGIFARAYLSKSEVVDGYSLMQQKWHAERAYEMLCSQDITLTSFVPTQLYDLVRLKKKSPPVLRAIIVGGGALPDTIYSKAIELGWKILPSYGLTECSSQVATACPDNLTGQILPELTLLPHIEAKLTPDGYVAIKSPSLLSLYALKNESGILFLNPKKEGWFETEDLGEIQGNKLRIKGRKSHCIKIGGESVDLLRLESILHGVKFSQQCLEDMVLVPMPDERLGFVIHLAAASKNKNLINSIVQDYQKQVLPYERIRCVHFIDTIPRTDLSKVIMPQLIQKILVS